MLFTGGKDMHGHSHPASRHSEYRQPRGPCNREGALRHPLPGDASWLSSYMGRVAPCIECANTRKLAMSKYASGGTPAPVTRPESCKG